MTEIKNFEDLQCVYHMKKSKCELIKIFTDEKEASDFVNKIEDKTKVKICGKVIIKGKRLSQSSLKHFLKTVDNCGFGHGHDVGIDYGRKEAHIK